MFNNAVRRVFNYKKRESVKGIVHGFCMAPINLYVVWARLLKLYVENCLYVCKDQCIAKRCEGNDYGVRAWLYVVLTW